jgi:hypothetical protein
MVPVFQKRIVLYTSIVIWLIWRRVLEEKRNKYNQVLIITDGVFSMDGDIALLPQIVVLAEEFGA